jgi:hypothetical protein
MMSGLIGNALARVRAEARAAWLAERPPLEKPTPDEIAAAPIQRDASS